MKERIERKEEAVKNLIEFLAKENDYSSMMTELAIAQSSAMKLAEISRIHGDKGYGISLPLAEQKGTLGRRHSQKNLLLGGNNGRENGVIFRIG